MNILFLQKSMGVGGVNVVTATLARKFQEEGHLVVIFAFLKGNNDMNRNLYGNAPIVIGSGFKVCKDNIQKIRSIILEHHIDLIINQWGLSYAPTAILKKACINTKAKWISYYHSDPLFNGMTHDIEMVIKHETNPLKRFIDKTKLHVTRTVTSWMMRHNYHACWKFMVLADSYINHFKQFTGLKNTEKLKVMNNPITIDTSEFVFKPDNKQNELIFVGRLDSSIKRVSRLVEVWSIIEPKFPNWKLTIVGDGPEKHQIKEIIKKNHLQNVELVGQQDPRPYYERAALLGLSSDFEGWPLVLGECMAFGVVPIVYGSFDSIYDIVEDGVNGMIVSKENGNFSVNKMANAIIRVIQDKDLRVDMMQKAIEKSHNFRIDFIYKQWNNIFENLRNERKNSIS